MSDANAQKIDSSDGRNFFRRPLFSSISNRVCLLFDCAASKLYTPLLSSAMILNIKAYWDTLNSTPFINESVPIIDLGNKSLADFIRHEIIISHPSTVYADTDIKAIKSGTGTNKLRILNYPATLCVASIEHESPAVLKVVIERAVQQHTRTISAFDRMVAASKPTVETYKSKWNEGAVLSFQTGYEVAENKANYLSSMTIEQKPNIDEQYEALGVGFLNLMRLGYKGGTGGEEKVAKGALKLMVRSLKFVGEHRGTMGSSRVKLYDGSVLLRAVKGCVSAKVKPGKREPLTKDIVLSHIKKVEESLAAFPGSYYRVGASGERYGEPILREIGTWKNIIGRHYDDMLKQDMRDEDRARNGETRRPNNFNSNAIVTPPMM